MELNLVLQFSGCVSNELNAWKNKTLLNQLMDTFDIYFDNKNAKKYDYSTICIVGNHEQKEKLLHFLIDDLNCCGVINNYWYINDNDEEIEQLSLIIKID